MKDIRVLLFFSLCFLFLCYTIVVYTAGTASHTDLTLTGKAATGKLIFQEKNCIACHQLYGLGGYLGPELTTVISARGKGRDYARAFIRAGSVRMPNFHLTDEETDCLVEFLSGVDRTALTYKNSREDLLSGR